MYFKHELECAKRSGRANDDSMSGKYLVNCPGNIRCCVMKRPLATVLGLVSQLFCHVNCLLKF